MPDLALALGGALFSIHVMSLALAWRKCRRRASRDASELSVTLVRPICGIEFDVEATLRSSFQQEYPNYEIVFCVARQDDPAAAIARRLIAAHPAARAKLLVGEARLSQNPKLNNMAKGWDCSSSDIVIFADSNILLPPDYCAAIASALAVPDTVLVTSPPVGDFAANFFGEVECAMLNTHAARWQFAAAELGLNFAQGKTLAFRRSAFGAGLMRDLAREPAEDAAATKIVREQGRALHVLPPPPRHPVGRRTLRSFWARHVRWARLRRVTFPLVFASEAACGVFPALLAFVLSPALQAIPLPIVAIATIATWHGMEFAFARALDWRTNRWFMPACLMRDAILPVLYAAAWVSSRFEWRGHSMDSAIKEPTS